MTQTVFTNKQTLGNAGKVYSTDFFRSHPKIADKNIEFGTRLSYTNNDKSKVDMMGTKKATLTLSTDLSASNVFSFTLKSYNTITKTEYVTSVTATYATSHASTMASIVSQCEANTGVHTDTAYTGDILSIIAKDDYILEVSSEAVAGGTAVTITKANTDTRLIGGFAMFCDKEMFEENDVFVSRYKTNNIVDEFRFGDIIVNSPTGFNGSSTLYVIGYGANRGQISNVPGNNGILQSDIKHYKTSPASGRGVVSVNIG